ncbi:hypothetical protein PM076_04665 [Halorubrum ezzemoulense]|uniref:NUDIX hydrolase n=1 Tax=Halorubrum ezzemoulense TaxID=337243 RepID=A0A256JTZ1_HALEZ|nr:MULTISPECIES: hypothetical protein [Halorubrum]MDB2245657.1 hypothetical protein [Halorubrum ezzemoulense]MDB2250543.1 hypothetical protein [Halorubrum ezzemoulense]MDB2278965.1 hypothetical protein [Halorubrum ezzemoulense]MDB2286007.1 hypothetical protein [Halorubrum ezzemoulense]MDB2287613.1 hypothetical protein [Halorubrum ezzemoulense]
MLGVEPLDPTAVGTFERVFERGGEPAHEVWRVYEGRIAEEWPYCGDSFALVEPERGTEHVSRWIPIDRLRQPNTTFSVSDVLDALTA